MNARGILALLMAMLCIGLGLVGCRSPKGGEPEQPQEIETEDLMTLSLSEYVTLGQYRGLTLTVPSGATASETVWKYVVAGSEIRAYPEGLVQYYLSQAKQQYQYHAERMNVTLKEAMEAFDVTEAELLEEARTLTGKDLVYYALLREEGISLTDGEKTENYERYVAKYVTDYGYEEAYVREHMTDQVYDSMLFDKTMEKLMSLNDFVYETPREGEAT